MDNHESFDNNLDGSRQEASRSPSCSRSSPDEYQNEQEDHLTSEDQPSTSRNVPMRLSVNRSNISSTTIQEGGEELENLGIQAYDQNIYERKVFEQVDRAILEANDEDNDQDATEKEPSIERNDLISLIHNRSRIINQGCEAQESKHDDERILELTRRERERKKIKKEKIIHDDLHQTTTQNLGASIKIPRISSDEQVPRIKLEPGIRIKREIPSPQPGPSITLYWTPSTSIPANDVPKKDDDISLSGESSISEYNPTGDQSCDEDEDDIAIDEDIDYETDNEYGKPDPIDRLGEKKLRKLKKVIDDGDPHYFKKRIKEYIRKKAKKRYDNIDDDGVESVQVDEMIRVDGELQIPKEMWKNLFEHQKTGVKWLWELHQLGSGGILGDEMGLGKTIQVIAFLTALRNSNIPTSHKGYQNLGPSVLVCPATVMYQWLLEFRTWWPPFRVAILHSTGTFSGDKKNLVRAINKTNGILIVSYPGVVIYQDLLHAYDWHYAILDEGHKIRNPDAQITLACKRFRTPHRLILSGSPVQNNLKELWSIFDFIYPGKLGTLPIFMEQFATPITQGGYANASDFQVQIAYKCSCVLRDTIKPFLMRRTKAEVNHKLKLPDRSEQVLFCKLTERQYQLYDSYLRSKTVRDIKNGLLQIFVGLTQLRKICNHPDLFDTTISKQKNNNEIDDGVKEGIFGFYKESGKMMVVDALLKIWKKQGHKVLLFTQSRQMLKIFMKYLDDQDYRYLSMDGQTSIGIRQSTIDKFNNTPDIFIFLLTTRVGGLGINLVGANRIIIFDPDWNPSTDIQARERAWRIGQHRQVTIYRLLTAGTIEEKIYHRQVFKLYLTNRILKDAKQKRFFKTNDLHELFTLGDNEKNIETKALFDDDLQINPDDLKKSTKKKTINEKKVKKIKKTHKSEGPIKLSDQQIQAMKDRAKQLSQMIALQYGNQSTGGSVSSSSLANFNSNVTTSESPSSSRSNPFLAKVGESSKHPPSNKKPTRERVEYLVRQDVYKPAGSGSSSREKNNEEQQDYILDRLFRSSNVFGALKHDKIESDSTSDYKVVESEAEKVARDAIRVLRESRRMCMSSLSGLPNWTGRNGHLAAPTPPSTASSNSSLNSYRQQEPRLFQRNRGRGQLIRLNTSVSNGTNSNENNSSGKNSGNASKEGSILSLIRKRVQNNPISLARATFNAPDDSEDEAQEEEINRVCRGKAEGTGADEMANKVREFMLQRLSAGDIRVPTDDLLEFFGDNFRSDQTPVFKAILYKICEFKRVGDKGFWSIKSEFRDQD